MGYDRLADTLRGIDPNLGLGGDGAPPQQPNTGARAAGPQAAPNSQYNWTSGNQRSGYGESLSNSRAVVPTQQPMPQGEKFMGNAQVVGQSSPTGARAAGPANPNFVNGQSREGFNQRFVGPQPGANPAAPTTAPAAPVAGEAAAAAGRMSRLRGALNGGLGKIGAAGAVIPTVIQSAANDSTARYARRFGVTEPTGDGSIGDIAKFIGLRAGGFASDLGNNLTFGLASKLYRDNDMPAQPAAQPVATPPAMVDASVQNPMQPSAAQSNLPDGVRKVTLDNGQPLYTNQPQAQDDAFNRKGGFVGVVPGMDMKAIEEGRQAEAEVNRMKMGLRDHGDINYYAAPSEEQRLTANLENASIGGRAGAKAALAAHYANQLEGTRQQGELARSNATLRLGMFNAMREQGNKDREFQLQQDQFANTKGQQAQKDRMESQDALRKRFESQFVTQDDKGNTVVDHDKVARMTTGVQQFLGNRVAELRKQGKTDVADELERRGASALGEEQLSALTAKLALQDRARETHGWLPGSSTYVDSNDPNDYTIDHTEQNLFGSPTLVTKNGTRIREADTRYTTPANPALPDTFKQRTSIFDPAKRGLRNGN